MRQIKFEDDPNRCQQVIPSVGQCRCIAIEGQKFCESHGGFACRRTEEQRNLKNYRLAKWNARADELVESSQIKTLREEIAILRILIEENIKFCPDELTLIMKSPQISDMLMKVEKLVSSCTRIENQLSGVLDKTQALQLISEITEIISKNIEDDEILSKISDEIMTTLDKQEIE